MKDCSRTRKVWPDAMMLEWVSSRSPLAWPSLTNEYILTDWPTRSIVMSFLAHSPFSNSSFALSSRTALAFLPVGFFLRWSRSQAQECQSQRPKKGGRNCVPRREDPALLANVEHGELDELLAVHALGRARERRVRHAQRQGAGGASRAVARVPDIASEAGGRARDRPASIGTAMSVLDPK